MNPGDTDARRHIDEILEHQRVEPLKREISDALVQNDYSRASRLIAEIQGPKPAPSPSPGPPTFKERPPRESKKFAWRWTFLVLGLILVVFLIMAIVAIAHYHYHGWHFINHWPFVTR